MWSVVASLTPPGLVALAVLLVLFGVLVPRRTMNDVIHDRDEWRIAHRLSEASRVELSSQVTALLEYARTTDALIRALPKVPSILEDQNRDSD
jgi:hypothetical protein